jgi:hypothetical protein
MDKIFSKDFLMGIGVGCIISAIVVFMYYPGKLSDQEIISRASELGMVKQPWLNTKTEKKAAPDKAAVPQNNSVTSTAIYKKPEQKINLEKPKIVSGQSATVVIRSGMGSETISRMLEENGAVKDQHEFYKIITEHRAHSKFRTGIYTIPAGTDIDKIVYILTGR